MKIKFYKFIITFLAFQFSNAQSNYYYYYKGNKVYLELDKSKINLITNQNFSTVETSNIGLKNYTLKQDQVVSQNRFAETEFLTEPNIIEFFQKINSLKSIPNIKNVAFYFKRNDTLSIGTSNYFYVKLKSTNDFNVLENFCLQKSVEVVKQVPYMPEWYILTATNPQFSSLELSNQFYESNLFADVDPAFMFNFRNSNCANDTNFGSLWGLNNTANPNIDINACQAWNITEGDNIKVAIIDGGINKNHPDLIANILPLSFNGDSGTSPSIGNDAHGTHIAGTIAAMKDNNLHIVGVAPKSKLISISYSSSNVNPLTSSVLASSLEWAWQNGAEIINCSWGDQGGFFYNQLQSSLLENAISNALNQGRQGKGCIVVFASGNYGFSNNSLDYPGNTFDQILTVGAINSSGFRPSFSAYGNKLDVVAPGVNILSLSTNNGVFPDNGTSFAAPHVAGIAALILSVNNCLTGFQVNTIIEQTSQKINPSSYPYSSTPGRPNGTWHNQLGYGLVDAHAAVLMAQSMGSTTLDLMVRDGEDDYGDEPNNSTQYLWASTDIWIRNNDDEGLEHQNPEYHPSNPNYAYVRVTNKSCVASTGNEILKFYWAKAGSSLSWPESWDGYHYFSQGPLLGAPVGQITIPVLQGGQETIVKIPFPVPNPALYNWFQGWEQWHFCLLARIEAINDPLTETNDLVLNVKNNNGIAWKNVTIVDVEENVTTGTIAVGNPSDTPRTFFLEFIVEDIETGKPIFEEAEVVIKMDDVLFNAWERGGNEAQLLDPTLDEKRKIVRGNHVILDNIAFNANEVGSLTLDFNFLIAEITDKPKFKYHLVQRDAVTGAIVGGETYEIKKKTRNLFQAIAPDKEVDLNQAITISAEDINEPAIYNWYDLEGNLIFQGKDLQIANAVAEKYKLEVIATIDGYKDYKEVEVSLKPSTLESITPNPATTTVAISYKLNQAGSAYLMIIGYYGSNGTSNNYILDVNSNAISLNLNNYPSGFYTVALVVNGEIVDAKTLIKQ